MARLRARYGARQSDPSLRCPPNSGKARVLAASTWLRPGEFEEYGQSREQMKKRNAVWLYLCVPDLRRGEKGCVTSSRVHDGVSR